MLVVLLGATLFASGFSYECDVTNFPESQRDLGRRVCRLENEVGMLEAAVGEMLQRTVPAMNSDDEPNIEKRKNEFIRFGKRSLSDVKRKNEFIRFGKRKNEFIRFGRSDPFFADDATVEKRKNEFIRFG
ncbi:hypothetical protein RB195_022004 [Necator americanus]|uniref:Uncharacterized protein n=2 Tax=Necator americanus TaxID=51031 RepID=W2TCE7_NECAM|nr:hypothetical protein NECAME_10076 [Necator americanus]ETN78851.1 hypothetical protein NECAME_10076 [Necator americanus]